MDQGFGGEDVSRVIYLLLYLFLVIMGLRTVAAPGGHGAGSTRTGLRGFIDRHPWAVGGAVWAAIIWGLLAARNWWIHEPGPSLVTLPLMVLSGLGIGWLLSLIRTR